MQYGIRPSADRPIEDLLKMAEIARKKYFDTFWLDQGVGGLAKAIDLAKQCIEQTKRAFYAVFVHPKPGDDLHKIAKEVLEFQTALNGLGYLVVKMDQFSSITEQAQAASELGQTLVPLVQKSSVAVDCSIFSVSGSVPLQSESQPVRVYLDTENAPELIAVAGQYYQGAITYPTLKYFQKVYEIIAENAKKTTNDLSRFDFVLSLPTFFGSSDIPLSMKTRILEIMKMSPPEAQPGNLPSEPSGLSSEQIAALSWSGSIYDINEKLLEYCSAFGDIGNPDNRLPFHIVVEEPFGPDAFTALAYVADESGYNYRIPFATQFEKEIRNVKDWHPPGY